MSNLRVPDQRFVIGAPCTPTVDFLDTDGDLAAAVGAVTVTIERADGTDVVTGAATTSPSTGRYQLTTALTGADVATLDLLTCTWSDAGDGSTHQTRVELVGGFYFTVAEARVLDPSLSSTSTYSAAAIAAARLEVEWEAEVICHRAFVPRFARLTLDGPGDRRIFLPAPFGHDLRNVTTASIDGTALTVAELAALDLGQQPTDNFVDRPLGAYWTEGTRNVVLEIEYGLDRPPPELARQAVRRLRSLLNQSKSAVDDRATSFSTADGGGTYQLDTPSAYRTGLPTVDAVYQRYSLRADDDTGDGAGGTGGSMPPPKSRPFDFDPQRNSLYHGGPR